MQGHIKLRLTAAGWVAEVDDPATIELFGTDTLPTGFTEHAKPELVRSEIQRLNPLATVTVADTPA